MNDFVLSCFRESLILWLDCWQIQAQVDSVCNDFSKLKKEKDVHLMALIKVFVFDNPQKGYSEVRAHHNQSAVLSVHQNQVLYKTNNPID